MGTLTYPFTLTAGQPENVNQLNSNLTAIANVLNGSIESANITDGTITATDLAAAVQAAAGLNGASTRRGKTIVATEEARTNTAFGLLTTPDRVSSIVLPTDGLIFVAYQALWKNSVGANAEAAIFLGANQLKQGSAAATTAVGNTTANAYRALASCPFGLVGENDGAGDSATVTTGQIVGMRTANSTGGAGPLGAVCVIFAAAGTYDVSIQFKAASGSVTAKERKLWVWSNGFD